MKEVKMKNKTDKKSKTNIENKTSNTNTENINIKGALEMNKKAEIFEKHLADSKMTNVFQKEELKDELKSVLFRSFMEIEGFQLPMVVILDESIYTIVRILVAGKGVTEKNSNDVVKLLNKLNSSYKAFKYMTSENGEVILDVCLPCTETTFDPNLIRVVIDVAIKNLNENYRSIIKTLWEEEGK